MLSNSADAYPIVANIIWTQTSPTNTFTFTTPSTNNALGTLTYSAVVTDRASTPVSVTMTNTLTITGGYTAPSGASCAAPSNALVDVGQYEQDTCTWTVGSLSDAVTQNSFSNGNLANTMMTNTIASTSSGTVSNTFQVNSLFISPNSPDTFNIIVSDSHPTTINSIPSTTFAANSLLQQGNVVASNQIIDQGQYEHITGVWVASGTYPLQGNIMVANSADAHPIISNNICASSGTVFNCAFTFQVPTTNNALGTITYSSNVIDSATIKVTNTITNTITIYPALVAAVPTASNTGIDSGQVTLLTSHPSAGSTSYSYQWYTAAGTTATCASSALSGATSSTYLASPTSTNTYAYLLTDTGLTTANTMCSSGLTIPVNTALSGTVVYSSNSLADQGQYETLTYNYGGGTPNFVTNMLISNSADANPIICNALTSGVAGQSQTLTCQLPIANNVLGPSVFIEGNVVDSATTHENAILTNTIAVNALLQQTRVWSSNQIIDQGQWETITDVYTGGTLKYTTNIMISNSANALPIIANAITTAVTATTQTYTFQIPATFNALGTRTVSGNVLDAASTPVANIMTNTITVYPALVAAVPTASNTGIDSGQVTLLTSHPSAGSTSYSYQWYTAAGTTATCASSALSGATSSTYLASPTSTNTYAYLLTDTGLTTANTMCSSGLTIPVNTALSGTVVYSSNSLADQGQYETLTYNYGGGTPNFVTNMLISNSADANPIICNALTSGVAGQSQTLTCQLPIANNVLGPSVFIEGNVVDSATTHENAILTNTIAVNALLQQTRVWSSNQIIDQGQWETITDVYTGGTLKYTTNIMISNSANALPIIANAITTAVTATTQTYTFQIPATFNALGTRTVSGNVLDAASTPVANIMTNTITVYPALVAAVPTASNTGIDSGQVTLLTSHPSAGSTSYSYQWYTAAGTTATCASSALSGATSSTYLASPTSTNTYAYLLTDTGLTTANTMCSSGLTIPVNTALSGTVVYSSNSLADQGQYETLTYNYGGGTPNFVTNMLISNSADANPIICNALTSGVAGQSQTLTCQLPIANNVLGPSVFIEGNVVDSATTHENAILTNTIAVNALLQQTRVWSSNQIIDQGQWETITDVYTGGTLKYTTNIMISNSANALPIIANAITTAVTATTQTYTFQIPATFNALGTRTVSGNVLDAASTPVANIMTNTITVYPALVAAVPTASNTGIDSGQVTLLTSHPSAGSTSYSYQWYTAAGTTATCASSALSGATSSTYLASPTSTNTYAYLLTDTGLTTANTMCSSGLTIPVNTALSGTVVYSSNSLADQGQYETLTYNYGGGTPNFVTNMLISNSADANPIICNALTSGVAGQSQTLTCQLPIANNVLGPSVFIEGNVVDSATTHENAILTNTIAVNALLQQTRVWSSNQIIDQGQWETITDVYTGGTLKYTTNIMISNSANALPIIANAITTAVTATTQTYTFQIPATFNALGTRTVSGNVLDAASTPVANIMTNTITVYPALVAAVPTASNTGIDSGQVTLLTSHPSAGSTSYSYQWYTAAGTTATCASSALSGATSSTYLASPTSTNTYAYLLTDTGLTTANTMCSSGLTIPVNTALSGTVVYSSNSVVDQGQYETITYNYAGGTPTFSTNMLISNSADANPIICNSIVSDVAGQSQTLICQIPAASNALGSSIFIEGNVIDSAPVHENAILTNTITINPTLSGGLVTMSNTIINVGQYDTFTASPSGGTTSYSYLWYSGTSATCTSDTSIPAETSSTYTTQPVSGNYYCVQITDSASTHAVAYSSANTPVISGPLSATALISSNALADQGQWETITYEITGGTPTYTYNIMVSNAADALPILFSSITSGSSSPTGTLTGQLPTTYNSLGSIQVSGNVVDSASANYLLINTITVNALLQQTRVWSSNQIIDQGQWETITDVYTGGTLKYTTNILVSNSADANPIVGNSITTAVTGTTQTYTFQIPTTNNALGTRTVSGNVLDAASTPVANVMTNTITVNPTLVVGLVTMSNAIVDSGQYDTFTASPSGGTSSFSYLWYSGTSATCASDTSIPSATSSTYTTQPVSGNYYCVQITDTASTPNVAYSATNAPTSKLNTIFSEPLV